MFGRYLYWSANLFGWAKHLDSGAGYGLLFAASAINTAVLAGLVGLALYGLLAFAG